MDEHVVEKLAEKLGVAVRELAPLGDELLWQVQMTGVARIVMGIIFLGSAAILMWGVKRITKQFQEKALSFMDAEIATVSVWVFGGAGAFSLWILGCQSVYEGVYKVVAPLLYVVNMIGG